MSRNFKDFDNDYVSEEKWYQSEIDWLNAEVSQLEKENNQLREDLDDLRAKYSIVVPELQDKTEILNQKILELESEKEKLSKTIETKREYQLDIVDLEGQIVNLKDIIAKLEEENEIRTERLKSDKFDISKLEHEIDDLHEKITKLENENIELRGLRANIGSSQNRISKLENKVYQLNRRISELEYENMTLSHTSVKIGALRSYVDKLEDTVSEYQDKITELEQENLEIISRITPSDIKKEINIRDENIVRLQKKLVQLKNQNKELIEKNQVLLKAALLLDVDTEAIGIDEKPTAIVSKEIPKESVQDLINKRHALLEGREIPKTSPEPKIHEGFIEVQEEPEKIHPPDIETPEIEPLTAPEISDVEDVGVIDSSGGRRQCPVCGNHDKKLIREALDRARAISAFAGLYAKKYICGKCGAEWH